MRELSEQGRKPRKLEGGEKRMGSVLGEKGLHPGQISS